MAYPGIRPGNPFGFVVTHWVKRLLIANGAVFVLTMALPVLTLQLAFSPARVVAEPWTIFTIGSYMFVHGNFFHLFFNMLVLFFFGPPLEERWTSPEFLKFYLVCGAGGAILSLIFWEYPIIGASAAIYGLMLAFAMYWPDNPIYIWGIFPVKAKWLVTFLIGLSLFYAFSGSAPGVAHIAHLGGAAAAFLYLRSSFSPGPFGPKPKKPKKPRPNVGSALTSLRAGSVAKPAQQTRAINREEEKLLDEIDRILDKISARGIESLTAEERTRLDEASRRFKTD
jgi:membrane associated rhomboid family serine protease